MFFYFLLFYKIKLKFAITTEVKSLNTSTVFISLNSKCQDVQIREFFTIVMQIPGSCIFSFKASILATSCSCGEFKTMTVDPITHNAHPSLPSKFNFSLKKIEDKTEL